jgi:hypothetical protein
MGGLGLGLGVLSSMALRAVFAVCLLGPSISWCRSIGLPHRQAGLSMGGGRLNWPVGTIDVGAGAFILHVDQDVWPVLSNPGPQGRAIDEGDPIMSRHLQLAATYAMQLSSTNSCHN